MDLVRIVTTAYHMTIHYGFYRLTVQIGSGQRQRVKQHILHIFGELVAIPNSEMVVLVPSKKKPFQPKGRKSMIDSSHRLRHAVIVSVLGLERKVLIPTDESTWKDFVLTSDTHICPYLP